jgi:hypothetical protein
LAPQPSRRPDAPDGRSSLLTFYALLIPATLCPPVPAVARTWRDRQLIQKVLNEYTFVPYSHGDIKCVPVYDTDRDHYLLVVIGWDDQRIHGCIVHIDLIDGKFWIQRDGTEQGIATDLLNAGVPKDRIVLAFHRVKDRPLTGFAVA